MFARILLRFWPTTFKNPVCWGFCIHCGQPSAKAAASPRDILHRTKDRVMTCLIRVFMGFSFLESLGLWLLTFGGKGVWGKLAEPVKPINNDCGERRIAPRTAYYSVRNAFIAVTRVARCAGKQQARSEAGAIMRLDVSRTSGSLGLTWSSVCRWIGTTGRPGRSR